MSETRPGPIRVVVVDDSPTVRELLVSLLQSVPDIQVVGVAAEGEEAVRLTKRLRPDVVTMDVFMPNMDGLEATRRIMREAPTPIVVVTATLKRHDVDLAFESLKSGALTAVCKPSLSDAASCDQLVQTVRLMADVPVVHRWGRYAGPPLALKEMPPPATAKTVPPPQARRKSPLLSTKVQRRVEIVGIASSTGGPAALVKVLGKLPADYPLPILVVQHVTRGFTDGLAQWLDGETPLRVRVAIHGDALTPGHVLIAPDDHHMQVNQRGNIRLSQEPPYKGLRPSANFLFDSLARTHGSQALGIVLTGMGDDGAEGLAALHQSGGLTIAQDEESCIVYGMPREAVARKAVDLVLPLDQISTVLEQQTQQPKRAIANA
jgi:two-component system chemotaxis response regulator CheB